MSDDSDAQRHQLRATHQVRLVLPHEEGCSAKDLPRGVFGFTSSAGLAAPLFATRHSRNFEIHHLRDGVVAIVGFVSSGEAEKLATAAAPLAITLYPNIDGHATKIVAVPYSQIAQHRQYSIRNTAGLELQIIPAHAAL
jgi:hypothetical protein